MSIANSVSRWLAVPLLALLLMMFSPGSPVQLSSADAAPRPAASKGGGSDVPGGRIKPYKDERKQRYTTESTQHPSTAPCAALPADPAAWPSDIVSCFGPPKKKTSPPPAAAPPAAPPARAAAPAASNGHATSGHGSGQSRAQQGAPSCG